MIDKLHQEQIEDILKDNLWGHLGCNDGFNTYVYPINYLYDGKQITCQSQRGFKMQVMQKNNRVCFQVDEVKNHKDWKSVMVLGEYQEISDAREYTDAIQAFADRRMFLKINKSANHAYSDAQEADMKLKSEWRPAIFKIVIDEKNGRFEME